MTLVNSSIPDPAFPVGSGQMLKVPGPGNPPGPAMIQIGTEGGFLRAPAVLNNQTIGFDALGSANQYTLLMGSGERTDVLIDFSNHPGETLDRKSTRLNSSPLRHLVCRLLLEEKQAQGLEGRMEERRTGRRRSYARCAVQ